MNTFFVKLPGLLIFKFPVVHDAANRGISVRGNFNQVKPLFKSRANCFVYRQNTQLLTLAVYNSDPFAPDHPVYSKFFIYANAAPPCVSSYWQELYEDLICNSSAQAVFRESTNCCTGINLRSSPLRWRGDMPLCSTSLSPTINM